MGLILWGRLSAASDVTMAAVTNQSSSQFRAALTALLQTVAAAIISDDETVVQAAQDAVADALATDPTIVQFGDPAIPSPNQRPTDARYLLREVDQLGRMSRGVRASDGANEMARADVRELQLSGGPDRLVGAPVGSGRAFGIVDADGRLGELTMDEGGMVPAWVLARWAQRIGVSDAGWDVLAGFGQSNMLDRNDAVDVAGEIPTIFKWSGGAIVPLSGDDTSPIAWAAREYASTAAATGRRILVVNVSRGSSGFTSTSITPAPAGYTVGPGTWDRTLTADPVNFATQAHDALIGALAAAGPTARLAMVAWSQGEQDTELLTKSQYAAKVDDLLGWLRASAGHPAAPIVVGSLSEDWYVGASGRRAVCEALAETPKRLTRVGYSWGPAGLTQWDQPIHWAWQGSRVRGRNWVRFGLPEALANQTAVMPVPPEHVRVTRSGTTVTAEWDRPQCHVDSLVVELTTDSATWTAMTLDVAHGSRATGTAAAGTGVQVRVAATNTIGQSAWQIQKG